MKAIRTLVLALTVVALTGPPAIAQAVRDLTWDDLLPKEAVYPPDPLETLTDAQRDDLGFVFRARAVKARAALPEDSPILQAMEERTDRLRAAGIDIDRLIERVRVAEEAMQQVDEMIVEELDGQRVRIPGYVVPLEFAGKQVTEFLLVPFIGACVHVPPPPANQLVLVQHKEGFDDVGLFAPVYVTGRMSAKGAASKSVYLTDGTVDVSFGYAMEGERIDRKIGD